MNPTLNELLRQMVMCRFNANAFRHLPAFFVAVKIQIKSLFYNPNHLFNACADACFDYVYESLLKRINTPSSPVIFSDYQLCYLIF